MWDALLNKLTVQGELEEGKQVAPERLAQAHERYQSTKRAASHAAKERAISEAKKHGVTEYLEDEPSHKKKKHKKPTSKKCGGSARASCGPGKVSVKSYCRGKPTQKGRKRA